MEQLGKSIREEISSRAKVHADREAAELDPIYPCEPDTACSGGPDHARDCPNGLHREATYHDAYASMLRIVANAGPLTMDELGPLFDSVTHPASAIAAPDQDLGVIK